MNYKVTYELYTKEKPEKDIKIVQNTTLIYCIFKRNIKRKLKRMLEKKIFKTKADTLLYDFIFLNIVDIEKL